MLHLGDLFKFSLHVFCERHVAGHVYVLAVLVALCSGVWPYTKLILLGVCWFHTPPRRGSNPRVDRCLGEVGVGRHLRDDADAGRFSFRRYCW